jgi:hypothetical protein
MCTMGQIATWIMLRRVYNPPKTKFRLRFAEPPKVTDRKAMVRGTSQLANASAINIVRTLLVAKDISPDSIFCKAPVSKKEKA